MITCFNFTLYIQAIVDTEKFKADMKPLYQKCADETGYDEGIVLFSSLYT